MKPFYTYMLRCADGHYYVGHTDDLERRLAEHQAGVYCGYTSRRLPVELLWFETFPTREQAQAIEAQLKRWSRAKKDALLRGDWQAVSEASGSRWVRRQSAQTSDGSTMHV